MSQEPTHTGAIEQRHDLTVEESEKKLRVDRLLANRLPELSRSRIQGLIAEGHLTIDGNRVDNPNFRVKAGQDLSLSVPQAVEAEPEAQAIALDVVYEDPHLIIVNKPAGMVVHPAPGNEDGTLVNALIHHCGDELKGIGGVKRPGIVHRIDKDTSGLMVAAKTETCHQKLVELFAAHDIQRRYQALVWGTPAKAAGTIEGNIGRSPRNRKKMAVVAKGGKRAVTHYKVLKSYAAGTVSLIECQLETGRTHQIRVHMTHIGHPLLGDPLYGSQKTSRLTKLSDEARQIMTSFNRQALHAKTLGFRHPITGEELLFESDLSIDLKDLINSL